MDISQVIFHFSNPPLPLLPHHLTRRAENLPVAKESCLAELQKGRFYFHGVDKKGRPVAYYSLACHDPKHRDIAEIMRMMTYQVCLCPSFLLSIFVFPLFCVFPIPTSKDEVCHFSSPPSLTPFLPPSPPSFMTRWRRPGRRCRRTRKALPSCGIRATRA